MRLHSCMTNATVVFWQDICIVKDNEEVKVNLSHQTTQQELCRRHLSFQILLWRLPLSRKNGLWSGFRITSTMFFKSYELRVELSAQF